MAIQHAVLSEHYNLQGKQILYADTTDPDSTHHIIDAISSHTKKRKKVLVNVISKSGTTTETIANYKAIEKKFGKSSYVSFVMTTDNGSKLQRIAEKKKYDVLTIPTHVGGRYSVFSAVGLFPLAVLGVPIRKLTEGARQMVSLCLKKNVSSNPALMLASLMYLHHKKGRKIHNQFVFSRDLKAAGEWYRQLLAESIGKNNKSSIVPLVSVGSVDLHSIGQEFIASDMVFHRFLKVGKHRHKVGSFVKILDAILKGTQTAFKKRKRPFVTITLNDKSAFSIGALLQMQMIEIMLLGKLLNVNPYDQPAVEEYKKETRKILE
jgi:glucose-6-phosphate isomerase